MAVLGGSGAFPVRSSTAISSPPVNMVVLRVTSRSPLSRVVSPGKGGLGTFSPLLDAAGNSVKGQLVARFLSEQLGMGLFVSKPEA